MGGGPAVLVGCDLDFRCVGAGYSLVCPAFPVLRSGLSAVVRLVWLAGVGAGRLCCATVEAMRRPRASGWGGAGGAAGGGGAREGGRLWVVRRKWGAGGREVVCLRGVR